MTYDWMRAPAAPVAATVRELLGVRLTAVEGSAGRGGDRR